MLLLFNSPINNFLKLGSIHNIYSVPSEPERAAKDRRAVVASWSLIDMPRVTSQRYSSAMFGQIGELFGHFGPALRSSQISRGVLPLVTPGMPISSRGALLVT